MTKRITHVQQKKQKALEIKAIIDFIQIKPTKRVPLISCMFKRWLKYDYAYVTLDQLEDVTGYESRQLGRLTDQLQSLSLFKKHNRMYSTTAFVPNIKLFMHDNLQELGKLIPEAQVALWKICLTSNQPIKSRNVGQYKSNIRISYNLPAITWTPAIPRSSSSFFLEEKIREREGPRHEMGSSAHEPSMFELQQWEIDHFDAMSASSWKELVN